MNISNAELTLPSAFFEVFPLLEDYLAPYALGDAALEAYFTVRRKERRGVHGEGEVRAGVAADGK